MFLFSFVSFLVYVTVNRHRGLAFFDATEYSTHIKANGVPHAPGYPLYTLLGKFFALFTGGDPFLAQYLISICSAFGAAAIFVYTLKTSQRSEPDKNGPNWHPQAAAITVLVFLSSYYVKLYTMLPEVFLFNLFIFTLMGLALDRWYHSQDSRMLFFVTLIYGLGFVHHHTLALTLPAFFILFFMKVRAKEVNWLHVAWTAPLGVAIGTLPLWYLFAASNPEPTYAYYHINSLDDLLFLVLRKGYGTFSLTVFDRYAPLSALFSLVLKHFARHLNYVGLLAVLPLFVGLTKKHFFESMRREPLLVFSVVTLIVFFGVFVPKNNIPLTFEHYKHIVLRFLPVPGVLMLYPIYFGLRKFLMARGELATKWAFGIYAIVFASNAVGFQELRFANYDLLDKHIEMGFRTIQSEVSPQPVVEINPEYTKCAIITRPDTLVFAVRYFNQFMTPRKCFFFTMASFSGQFRSKNEEVLQKVVLDPNYGEMLMRYASDPPVLLGELFARLRDKGFRIFLFYATDSVVFNRSRFRYRPIGNIQELVYDDVQFPVEKLLGYHEQYLHEMNKYLDDLAKVSLPHLVLDESVSSGVFQNLNEYRKLTAPFYATQPELGTLDREVQAKFDRLFPEVRLDGRPQASPLVGESKKIPGH